MVIDDNYKSKVSEYVQKAKSMVQNPSLIEEMIEEAWEKGKNIDPRLRDLMDNLETFIEIVRAYFNGSYRDLEQRTILFLIAGILYFINPLDIIPDILPLIGFTDDAAVLIFILSRLKGELEKYKLWKLKQEMELYESESEI